MFKRWLFPALVAITALGIVIEETRSQPTPPENPTAEEVLECSRENWVDGTFYGDITIELVRPEFSRIYQLEVWQRGEDKAFIAINAPESEAGSGYLRDGDNLWFYAPDAGVAVELPSSALSENLLGADLSIDDISRGTLSENFDLELLGTRTANEEESELEDDRVHQLRLTPKPETPVVYGKLELLVRDSDCATLRIDYFDQRDTLIREAKFSEFAVAGEEGNERVIAQRAIFDDLLNEGSRTTEIINSFEIDIDIPEQRFTLECLEQDVCG